MLYLVSAAIGREASKMGGCVCHEDILTADMPPPKRLRLMKELTGHPEGKCPWKGKCATRLAMGAMTDIVRNVKQASSARYQGFCLSLQADAQSQEILSRMLHIEAAIKNDWSDP